MTSGVKGLTMLKPKSIALAAYLSGLSCLLVAPASWAADPTQYLPSTLPGYAKTQEKCLRCHTAEPMAYQPQDAPRTHWESMVKRMKRVFKAKLDDAEIADIVDYMAKTYGNERAGFVAAPKEVPKEPLQPAVNPVAAQPVSAPLPVAPSTAPVPASSTTPLAATLLAPVPASAKPESVVKPEAQPDPAPAVQYILPNRRK